MFLLLTFKPIIIPMMVLIIVVSLLSTPAMAIMACSAGQIRLNPATDRGVWLELTCTPDAGGHSINPTAGLQIQLPSAGAWNWGDTTAFPPIITLPDFTSDVVISPAIRAMNFKPSQAIILTNTFTIKIYLVLHSGANWGYDPPIGPSGTWATEGGISSRTPFTSTISPLSGCFLLESSEWRDICPGTKGTNWVCHLDHGDCRCISSLIYPYGEFDFTTCTPNTAQFPTKRQYVNPLERHNGRFGVWIDIDFVPGSQHLNRPDTNEQFTFNSSPKMIFWGAGLDESIWTSKTGILPRFAPNTDKSITDNVSFSMPSHLTKAGDLIGIQANPWGAKTYTVTHPFTFQVFIVPKNMPSIVPDIVTNNRYQARYDLRFHNERPFLMTNDYFVGPQVKWPGEQAVIYEFAPIASCFKRQPDETWRDTCKALNKCNYKTAECECPQEGDINQLSCERNTFNATSVMQHLVPTTNYPAVGMWFNFEFMPSHTNTKPTTIKPFTAEPQVIIDRNGLLWALNDANWEMDTSIPPTLIEMSDEFKAQVSIDKTKFNAEGIVRVYVVSSDPYITAESIKVRVFVTPKSGTWSHLKITETNRSIPPIKARWSISRNNAHTTDSWLEVNYPVANMATCFDPSLTPETTSPSWVDTCNAQNPNKVCSYTTSPHCTCTNNLPKGTDCETPDKPDNKPDDTVDFEEYSQALPSPYGITTVVVVASLMAIITTIM